jgi:sec-independent protein translocase protein TatB
MFDIGFAELILIGVVGLLVIGPERLPGTIRTARMWLNRLKRGFDDIKREVEQELHNDAVMQDLRKTGEQLKSQTDSLGQDIHSAAANLSKSALDDNHNSKPPAQPDSQAATPGPTPDQPANKSKE